MSTRNRKPKPPSSPIEAAYDHVGGKWKPVVLYHLMHQTRRFNDLRRQIPNITQRALTLQLRELEADGLIHRKVFQQIPPKVEYSLSAHGKSLIPWLTALNEWAEAHVWPGTESRPNEAAGETDARHGKPEVDNAGKTVQTARAEDRPQQVSRVRASTSPGRPWGATGAAKIG